MCPECYKPSDRYHWCTYPHDVECGDRDCPPTSVHCPEPTTRPTTTEDCSSTPPLDCDAMGEMMPEESEPDILTVIFVESF